jgi:2-(1,2-epoxy-1,2-dihydrophenyl)acetyl-CoA isomerase
MAASEILTEHRGNTLIITFNRPEHANALTLNMANQLFSVVKSATTDRSVRCLLLWGAGDHFMNGLDANIYAGNIDAAQEQANQLILPYHSTIREFLAMDKPVLSAVEGRVTGAGLSLMLASDLTIAAENTTFNSKFIELAMTPEGGCTYFLPRKVGASRAMEILMLNEAFDVATAERLHLVNKVVPNEQLKDAALEWADRLANGPTRAFGGIKKLVMQSFEQNLNAQLGLEHSYWGQTTRSFDFHEAVKAFFAKRPPKFSGA